MTSAETTAAADTGLITLPLHLVQVIVLPHGLILSDCHQGEHRHHRLIPFATPMNDDETINKLRRITFFPMAQVCDGDCSTWAPLSETFDGDILTADLKAPASKTNKEVAK